MTRPPIALFVYNRPEHTRKTVEALALNDLATESDLFVFSDGPKNREANAMVVAVRKYVAGIVGFRSVTIIERPENFGLARSIISGVTELVNRHGRIIVLEDDLITSPSFLRYMNDALDFYQNEQRIMQISGHMFESELNVEIDAIFLSFVTTWGWATWSRAWKYFDPSMSGYSELCNNRSLRHQFDLNGNYGYFDLLKRQISGAVDSWGIVWNLSIFMKKGLVLYPVKTLVTNGGFDGSGTHCKETMQTVQNIKCTQKEFRFPTDITESGESESVFNAIYKDNHPSIMTIIKHKLKDWL